MKRAGNLGTSTHHGFSSTYQNVCWLLSGLSLGAALMYLFDPDRGRGRRAKLGDQLTSKINDLGEAAQGRAKDLGNRAKGVFHEVKSALPGTASRSANEPERLSEPLA